MDKSKLIFDKDNPYIPIFDEIKNKYLIYFKDLERTIHEIEVSKAVYLEFVKYNLLLKRQQNEFDRHIEHSEVFENTLNNRIMDKPVSIEDEVIRKATFEDVIREIEKLPEIQKRRIKKYYCDKKTFEQIAQEEHCTKRAIKFSVDIAIKEIYKKITG